MRFLIDENLPFSLTEMLRGEGHEVFLNRQPGDFFCSVFADRRSQDRVVMRPRLR